MTATLAVGEGQINIAEGNSGVVISGGNGSSSVELTGTLAQIDNLLTGISNGTIDYINNIDTPSATTALTLTVNDGGNTGSDAGLTGDPDNEEDSASQIINITAINDNPVNAGTLPVGITVTEDELSDVNLASIDLSDVDADGGALTVNLTTATGGELTASAGIGITAGGTTTALTVTGTLTDLNAYFNTSSNIWYQHGAADLNGDNADTIQINVNDNGNTGSGGGSDVDLGTVTVDINAVNDAPVNTVPGTQSVEEEATTAITGSVLPILILRVPISRHVCK